jgi:hypothetical protein
MNVTLALVTSKDGGSTFDTKPTFWDASVVVQLFGHNELPSQELTPYKSIGSISADRSPETRLVKSFQWR